MWTGVGIVLSTLALVSPEPLADDISELQAGLAPSARFATDAQGLQQKLQHTVQMMERFPDKSKEPQEEFTWSELSHYDGTDLPCYLAIDNSVYDFDEFIQYHPPGPEPIKRHAGRDASAAIRASGMPEQLYRPFLRYFRVGYIKSSQRDNSTGPAAVAEAVKSRLSMGEMKRYTRADVAGRNGRAGAPLWIIVRDSVYDVTAYVNEHPGGADALRELAGRDATRDFDDVGHSADARAVRDKYKIGEIVQEDKHYNADGKKIKKVVDVPPEGSSRSCLNIVTCGLLG